MPITPRTLVVVGQARDGLGAQLAATDAVLTARWVRAWDLLAADFERAIAELEATARREAAAATAAGTTASPWPSRGQVLRSQRLAAALATAQEALEALADTTYDRTIADARAATVAAARDHALLTATQLPAAAGAEAALAITFNKVDTGALQSIVARTTQQVTALTRPLSAEATNAMTNELIRGVATGKNSATIARRIVASSEAAVAHVLGRTEDAFNGGLTRAMNIARTEVLDAYRASGAAQDAANRDVLAGWTWVAKLDRLTCPSCFAQHGSVHPVDEPGPLDHQQGRCARVPKTKTWRDLGFDIDEPPSALPDARAVYDSMSAADQLSVMGPSRRDALADGRISFDDLSRRRSTPGWRDSFAPTPVRVLLSTSPS